MSADTVMLDETFDPEADEEEGGRSLLRILLVILIVVAVAAGATWWFLLRAPAEATPLQDGEVVVLEPLTTTLGESSLRHARVNLAVVLVEGTEPEVVEAKAAILQDALLREVASMDADQLRSSEGSNWLRDQLTDEAHEIWGDDVVRRVLLTELLVQ